jgi:hypothetical protein
MKILLTGFTTRMVNSQNLRNNYLTCEPSMIEILNGLGHTVDHRKVTPGEDLSQYDVSILGICGIQSRVAAHANGTAWAFETANRRLLFCGDWSIEKAGLDFQNALGRWEKYGVFAQESFQYTSEDVRRIKDMITAILTQRLPLLATFFPWGNHQTVVSNTNRLTGKRNLPMTDLCAWDPSPFLPMPAIGAASERERRWIYPTLQDHDEWIKSEKKWLKWPIVQREKKNKILESELLKEYASSWGILTPPYKTAGSGWWRARFNHAAHVGAIIACDSRDGDAMCKAYSYKPMQIEAMAPDQLSNVAQQQREWFNAHIATRDKTISDVERALRAAVSSDRRAPRLEEGPNPKDEGKTAFMVKLERSVYFKQQTVVIVQAGTENEAREIADQKWETLIDEQGVDWDDEDEYDVDEDSLEIVEVEEQPVRRKK